MYHLQVSGSILIDAFPTVWDGIEVIVFGYRFIVGRLQPVCWNLQTLSLVSSVLSFILILVFFLLFIFLLHFRFSLFSEYREENAFSAGLAWEETIDRDVCADEIARDIPSFIDIVECDRISPQLLTDPGDILFVFVGIEGAGRVDEETAWFQAVPDIAYDFALQVPAVVHILQAPFADGAIILAEHTFAGAGNISEDDIKLKLRLLVVAWIVVGDDHIGMTELLDILCKNLRSGAHRFVAEKKATFRQGSTYSGRFSTWSRTEIEHHHRFVNELSDHQIHEHGRSLLHVILSCMEPWVEGEVRTGGEITAGGRAPWNRFARSIFSLLAFERIEADAGRCFSLGDALFQLLEQFIAHQLLGILDEIFW